MKCSFMLMRLLACDGLRFLHSMDRGRFVVLNAFPKHLRAKLIAFSL